MWNFELDDCLVNDLRFTPSKIDPCLYIKTHADGKVTFILVYVDDLLVVGHKAKEHLQHISKRFKITIQESPSDFLGVEISRNRHRKQIKLHLKSYIDKTLEKFNMQNCKPATTPMAVGAIRPTLS